MTKKIDKEIDVTKWLTNIFNWFGSTIASLFSIIINYRKFHKSLDKICKNTDVFGDDVWDRNSFIRRRDKSGCWIKLDELLVEIELSNSAWKKLINGSRHAIASLSVVSPSTSSVTQRRTGRYSMKYMFEATNGGRLINIKQGDDGPWWDALKQKIESADAEIDKVFAERAENRRKTLEEAKSVMLHGTDTRPVIAKSLKSITKRKLDGIWK